MRVAGSHRGVEEETFPPHHCQQGAAAPRGQDRDGDGDSQCEQQLGACELLAPTAAQAAGARRPRGGHGCPGAAKGCSPSPGSKHQEKSNVCSFQFR